MAQKSLEYYFDFLSPFAYLSWHWVRPFCKRHNLWLVPRPLLFGALLNHHGQLGPAEIAPKREAIFKQVLRLARAEGVPISAPLVHPFLTVAPLRMCLKSVAGDAQEALIDGFWKASWQDRRDISQKEVAGEIVADAGLDPKQVAEQIQTPEVKAELRAAVERAIQQGVFGVPTMVLDGELFWGTDQRAPLEAFVAGDRGYGDKDLELFLNMPTGVVRKRPASLAKPPVAGLVRRCPKTPTSSSSEPSRRWEYGHSSRRLYWNP